MATSIERTIVLPIQDNDGHSNRKAIDAIHAEVLAIAGGYSELPQTGVWLDDQGQACHDDSLRLTTTVDASQDRRIAARLPVWCAWLRQQCLYTHTVRIAADFILPAESSQAAS